jgi:hypothetical protein
MLAVFPLLYRHKDCGELEAARRQSLRRARVERVGYFFHIGSGHDYSPVDNSIYKSRREKSIQATGAQSGNVADIFCHPAGFFRRPLAPQRISSTMREHFARAIFLFSWHIACFEFRLPAWPSVDFQSSDPSRGA